MNLNIHRNILLSMIIFGLVLSFQNCSNSYKSNKSQENLQSTSGNGDAYDGKLRVLAPEIMTPGQSVDVYVQGGSPPYQLESTSSTGTIVETSLGVYKFTVGQSESLSSIQIQATDANGNVAVIEIQIWGINRWFFDNPRGLAVLSNGNLLVAEENRLALTLLSPEGEVRDHFAQNDINNFNIQAPNHLVIDSRDQVFLSDSSTSVFSINLETQTVVFELNDSEENYWNSCGGITHLQISPEDLLVVSCAHSLFFFDSSGSLVSSMQLVSSNSEPIGAFLFESDGNILVSKPSSQMEVFTPSGNLVESFRISGTGEDLLSNYYAGDLLDLGNGEMLFVNDPDDYGVFRFERSTGRSLGELRASEGSNLHRHDFSDATLLPNGNIALTQAGSDSLMIFDINSRLVDEFGFSSSDIGAFYYPADVFVRNNVVTVHDRRNLRISQFDHFGNLLRVISNPNNEDWWLKYSDDIFVDKSGVIYSAWTGSNRVEVIELDGTVRWIDGIEAPIGIYVTEQNQIFTTNEWTRKITAYNMQGQFQFEFENPAGRPAGIEIVGDRVYVVDFEELQIEVYDLQGRFLKTFISLPEDIGPMKAPRKITFDETRELFYVTDTGNDRILIYNSSGNFIATFGERGYESGQFRAPNGIDVDENGTIFIVDSDNSRVQILHTLLP